jgi:hypothetical protein
MFILCSGLCMLLLTDFLLVLPIATNSILLRVKQPNSARPCTVSHSMHRALPYTRICPHACLDTSRLPSAGAFSVTHLPLHASPFFQVTCRIYTYTISFQLPSDSMGISQWLRTATTRSYAPRLSPRASPFLLRMMLQESQSASPSTLPRSPRWTRL